MLKGIIDVHIHPFLRLINENDLLTELMRAEVDLGVLLALDVDPDDLDQPEIRNMILQRCLDLYVWDAPRVIEELKRLLRMVRTDNEQVANLVKRHPDKFLGFGSINLSKSETHVEEKLREIDRLNLSGIKLIPTLQFFHPIKVGKKLERVFKHCERREKIVMCHTGCDPYVWEYPEFSEDANPRHLKPIVEKLEGVPVVLAHMGCYSSRSPGVWLEEALKLGKDHENVWFDIAAVTYAVTRRDFVDRIRKAVGMDRILFGSDYPAVQGLSIKSMIDEVKNSPCLTEEEKVKILGLNALRLLNLRS
ncbi:MAG: Amidohydrolase [Candidatus Bathyarchaeota archaeon BA1]|nr:MAG: Amidohydrolase [Candidatus Bathyarchaeota archaeon BA1]